MEKYTENNLTDKQLKYLINKYMGNHGGLNPKNIEIILEDGYEFAEHQFGGVTIKKKKK